MMDPSELAEKIRNAPSNSTRIFRKLPPKKQEERIRKALDHDNDAGMSAVDEYVYLKQKEANE
ncbi:MAG: hypothetical protein LBT97_08280 [Planctomycetota bacterium]|jgi:hypothetical protein|nr:hypothetical protein [Planctomycetota bacterium]